jgi:AcrR family transcriptional regulator
MVTTLEKARKDLQSTKGRFLTVARCLFGKYGFHGTTTRMIASEVRIDVATFHYHWDDKRDLYDAVVLDISKDFSEMLIKVDKMIHSLSSRDRLSIFIDEMTAYLFKNQKISRLIMFRSFDRPSEGAVLDLKISEFAAEVTQSIGLISDKRTISPYVQMVVIALMNSMHNFVSGENLFRPMINVSRESYIQSVKETLKFIHIPAFTQCSGG